MSVDQFVKFQADQTVLDWGLETKCLTPAQHENDSKKLRKMYGVATA